jgi:hypothetical protein
VSCRMSFTEPDCSILCSQESTTERYPESTESSPHSHIHGPLVQFNVTCPNMSRSLVPFFSFSILHLKTCMNFSSSPLFCMSCAPFHHKNSVSSIVQIMKLLITLHILLHPKHTKSTQNHRVYERCPLFRILRSYKTQLFLLQVSGGRHSVSLLRKS